ncbi:hypothetical protein Hanom_Chr11g01053891 [Helianthus anomalus]
MHLSPHPCFVQFPTILSSRMMIFENFGLIVKSGYQHFSVNLQKKEYKRVKKFF